MGTPRWLTACLGFCAAGWLSTVLALTWGNNDQGTAPLPLGGSLQQAVPNIPYAHRIDGWQHLDDQHVVLQIGSVNQYLITLKDRCLGLSWARNVGVTMSNNTIWAGFDAITVDGIQCEIETINPVHAP